MPETEPLDIDSLWDFEDPALSEGRFREALPASHNRTELLTQLARAVGLQRRYQEALEIVAEAERDAQPESRGEVRCLLEHGRILNSSGQPSEARPLFEQAFALADRIGEEALAVDAAHMVANVAPPEEQIVWNERALEMARRSEDPKAQKWRSSLLNNLAWTYHGLGEYERALALFEEARELREQRGEAGNERIARYAVGHCLRSMGRVDEALNLQLKLKADHQAAGTGVGYVEEEIGRCLLALGRADEARPYFAEAVEKFTKFGQLEGEPERLKWLRERT